MTTTSSASQPQGANAAGVDPSTQPVPGDVVTQAVRGTGAARQGRAGGEPDDTAPPPAFADLLAQPPTPPPASPPAPAPVPAPSGNDSADSGSETPVHLLALLDGSWNVSRTTIDAPAPGLATARGEPKSGAQLPSALAMTVAAAVQPAPQAVADGDGSTPAGAATLPFAAELATAAASTDLPASTRDTAAATQPGVAIESAAALAPAAPARTAAAPPLPPLQMPADPAAGFDDGLGTRVVWMAEQRLGHAEIRLNPEHVGPIEVRVELDGEQVRAEFHSAHAEVRQAIESSLPRLRELLGQHGLQLGHADVGQGQAGREGGDARSAASARVGDDSGGGEDLEPRPAPVRVRGLVDAYA